jgi:hypothetical protein
MRPVLGPIPTKDVTSQKSSGDHAYCDGLVPRLAVALSLPYVLAHFDYTHWDVISGLLVPSLYVAVVLALAVATPGRLRKPLLSPMSYEGMGRV